LKKPAPDEVLETCDGDRARDGHVQIACLAAARQLLREYRVAWFRFAGPGREPFLSNCLD
jgi:hypothetical protein